MSCGSHSWNTFTLFYLFPLCRHPSRMKSELRYTHDEKKEKRAETMLRQLQHLHWGRPASLHHLRLPAHLLLVRSLSFLRSSHCNCLGPWQLHRSSPPLSLYLSSLNRPHSHIRALRSRVASFSWSLFSIHRHVRLASLVLARFQPTWLQLAVRSWPGTPLSQGFNF